MRKILFSLSIVLLFSSIIFAQGLGTLRDNTKVKTSVFNEYKTEVGISTDYIKGLVETEVTDRENADIAIMMSTPSYGLSRTDIENSTFTHLQANKVTLADGTVITSTAGFGGLSSSSTARIPTVYVCASNSPQELKSIAQYVCDGVNDSVEINSALNDLNNTGIGGTVFLEAGTYSLNEDNFDLFLSSYITIEGREAATVLNIDESKEGTALFNIRVGAVDVTIRKLKVLNSGSNTKWVKMNGTHKNITIEYCRFETTSGESRMILNTSSGISINHNYIDIESEGIQNASTYISDGYICDNTFNTPSAPTGGAGNAIDLNNIKGFVISNNIIKGCDIGIKTGSSCREITIAENQCIGSWDYGFYLAGSSFTITGNMAYNSVTANAAILVTRSKDEGNSWNSDQLNIDGSNAMTANLNMGNNAINFCPTIITSTSDIAGLKLSSPSWAYKTDSINMDGTATGGSLNIHPATLKSTMTIVAPPSLATGGYVVTITSQNGAILFGVKLGGCVYTSGCFLSDGNVILIGSMTVYGPAWINDTMFVENGIYKGSQGAADTGIAFANDKMNIKADNGSIAEFNMGSAGNRYITLGRITAGTNDVEQIRFGNPTKKSTYTCSSGDFDLAGDFNTLTSGSDKWEEAYNVLNSSSNKWSLHPFEIVIDTPSVGMRTPFYMSATSFTITDINLIAGVVPTGANLTITITTGTQNATGAGWLTGSSLGTLTIVDGKVQSNTLSPNQYIAKNMGIVFFDITAVGSTTAGFNIAISGVLAW